MDREPLILAKRQLYAALMAVQPDDLMDNEIELMVALADDKEVQSVLETARLRELNTFQNQVAEMEDTGIDMEDEEYEVA